MRFFEVASPNTKIVASNRFLKNAAFFLRGYPTLKQVLHDFLVFKQAHPREQFGKKDAPFTGSKLAGQYHAHLVHGKVIVVYGFRGDTICLYDMVEHTAVDTQLAINSMVSFIASLDTSSMQPVKVGEDAPTLKPEQKQELTDLFYEMAVQDADILASAARGDFADLMTYCDLVVDAPHETTITSFGGKEEFQKLLQLILKQFGHR